VEDPVQRVGVEGRRRQDVKYSLGPFEFKVPMGHLSENVQWTVRAMDVVVGGIWTRNADLTMGGCDCPGKTGRVVRPLLAHACNPNYSGGRDQEDHILKPARANSSQDPISKILNPKKGWWSGSRCGP
jgi:hypothetical protein